jgi:CBS domain-containing protein
MELAGADPIRWLVGRETVEVRSSDALRRAAEVLHAESVGAVVVLGPGGLAGVLSERDIVRALAEGGDPDVDRVSEYMTYEVMTVEASEPVSAVAAQMLANEIRHVVVTSAGALEGVVSIRDVLAVLLSRTRDSFAPAGEEVAT